MASWTDKHANVLQAVFEALNKSGIPWMVLRNYEGLPFYNRAKDIDITVPKKDFKKTSKIISEVLSKNSFDFFTFTRYQYAWCFTFFNISGKTPISIKIDIADPFVWRGAYIFDFNELYNDKQNFSNFNIPSRSYNGLMLLVKPLMTGGYIKEKYTLDILNAFNENPESFCSVFITKFGENLLNKVKPYLENGQLDSIVRYKNQMRLYGWLNAFIRKPLKTIYYAIAHFFVEIKRRSRRAKGSFIAFVGPDGSGKSTIAELFRNEICRIMVKDNESVNVLHFRPTIFPNLKKLFYGRSYDETKENFTNPHRAKPSGLSGSLLRLTYYWIDYIIGYWFYLRSKCVAGQIFIFDRYFYDFIVDPYRSRINLPIWIRFLFLKLTPKPDIVYFLDCDSKTILERKKELSEEEIIRQVNVYRYLANKYKNFYSVNSGKKENEILNDIVKEYVKRISSSVSIF